MIIQITSERPKEYSFSGYKKGWVLEVIEDYDKYITAMVLTGSEWLTHAVIAVHKDDYEIVNLHKDITKQTREPWIIL